MTKPEAKAIIRKEYLCVDRDCDIEKNCGRCDLMIPSKEPILEAYKMAMDALEQEPCDNRQAVRDVLDKIKVEMGRCKTLHEMQLSERDTKGKLLISDIFCHVVEILDRYRNEVRE